MVEMPQVLPLSPQLEKWSLGPSYSQEPVLGGREDLHANLLPSFCGLLRVSH